MLLDIKDMPQVKDYIIKDGYVMSDHGYTVQTVNEFFIENCLVSFVLTQNITCILGLDDKYSYITVELDDRKTRVLRYTVSYPEHDIYHELIQQKPNVVDRVRELVPDLDAITKLFFKEV